MVLEVPKKGSIRENEELFMTAEVIYGLRSRREFAFEVIYRIYNSAVFAIVYSTIYDVEATRDLCQDTFLRFWESSKYYFNVAHVRRSLFKIASNLAIDFIRRKRISYALCDVDWVPSKPITTEIDLQFKEALSKREYNVMVLAIIHGLTRSEIADMLKLKLPTVGNNYRRALVKLRKYYGIADSDIKKKPESKILEDGVIIGSDN